MSSIWGPGAGVHGGDIVAAGHAARDPGQSRLAYRPIPEWQAPDRPAATAHATLPDKQIRIVGATR